MDLFKSFGLRDQKNQKSKKKPQFSHVLPTMVNKHHEISSSGQVPIGKVVLQRGKFITKIAGSIGINLD